MEDVFSKNLKKLFSESKKIATFCSIAQLISWDQETYMPKKAIDPRSEQLAIMSALIHKKKTSKKYKNLLDHLIDLKTGDYKIQDLTLIEKAALREWRKEYLQLSKLKTSFVEKFSKITSKSINIWANARKNNDFALFQPYLQKIVDLNKEKAEILGYEKHPLDPLLDTYEPEMTVEKLEKIFPPLKEGLISLLQKIKNSKEINDSFLHQEFSIQKQKELNEQLFKILPLDEDFCRIDISTHPFSTSLHPRDVRFTTRISKDLLFSNIASIMHEAGHAMYDMGLLEKYFGSPICEAISTAIHESQSRFWETLIGKSFSFCSFLFPKLQTLFPLELSNVALRDFYKAINKAEGSLIRIEADEVTYSLHIILRYEIEKELISGTLKVKDVPHVWNEKMKEYLSVSPSSDSLGCLQDIHWSMGSFGYFPTYALGNINAAQFFEKFKLDNPSFNEKIAKGELAFIREWLKQNIHQYGKTYSSDEICERITKKKLSAEPYLNYLSLKYSEIYGF